MADLSHILQCLADNIVVMLLSQSHRNQERKGICFVLPADRINRMESRIKKVLKNNSPSLIFMGGSVTEGYPYDERVQTPYPQLTGKQINKIFSEKTVTVKNLGAIGDKVSHALLCSEDKLEKNENQIIFLEYALNDEVSQTSIKLFESLVRKIICFPGKPAVLSLIFPKQHQQAIQYQQAIQFGDYIQDICRHYHIPCLNPEQYIRENIEEKNATWTDYSFDGIHPAQSGHQIIADCIVDYLMKIYVSETDFSPYRLRSKRFLDSPFEHLKLLPLPKEITYPFTFSVECRTVWISYIQHEESFMGNMQVFADNELIQNLHGKSFYCWYYPVQLKLFENRDPARHTITLQMARGDEKKTFLLEYIGIC